MVRKVGGFTFQELNLTIEDIRDTGAVGADLSYDFVEPTRVPPRAGHPAAPSSCGWRCGSRSSSAWSR